MDSVAKLQTKEQRHAAVQQMLLKWLDPKPEYSGITAWEMAWKVMAAAEGQDAK